MEKQDIKIQVSKRGPYIVQGSVTIIDTDGKEIVNKGMIALCRCGGSKKKPYCDGTHTSIGFKG